MFLDHTQRRSTIGRTPLDEWSARRRDLYLTTHDNHNRQISMPPVEFEPTISAGERPVLRVWSRNIKNRYSMYVCVCVCIYIYVCVYIYIYDISSLRVNQLLYYFFFKFITNSLTIFVNWNFQEILTKDPSSAWGCDTSWNIPPCGWALRWTCRCTEFYRVKNANLRHPSAMC